MINSQTFSGQMNSITFYKNTHFYLQGNEFNSRGVKCRRKSKRTLKIGKCRTKADLTTNFFAYFQVKNKNLEEKIKFWPKSG